MKTSTQLRELAVTALHELCRAYYVRYSHAANTALVHRYLTQCQTDLEESVRMGSVSALGAMSRVMLLPCLDEVLSMLMRQSLKPDQTLRASSGELTQTPQMTWAEARRDSVKALIAVVETIGFLTDGNGQSIISFVDRIFACLLIALQEYTIDDRGDIGAWVRETAMMALYRLVTICPKDVLRPDTVHAIMTGFAQQAVENIDRTRGLAGSLFCKLVNQ